MVTSGDCVVKENCMAYLPRLHYFLWSFLLVISHPSVGLHYYKRRCEEMYRALGSGLKDLGFNTSLTIA